jgi:hypothetical protein
VTDQPAPEATPACIHPDGYDGECPCLTGCGCCKVAPAYPHEDGDVTVLGPETFASKDGAVISWRGGNYTRQPEDPCVTVYGIDVSEWDRMWSVVARIERAVTGWTADDHAGHGSPCEKQPDGVCAHSGRLARTTPGNPVASSDTPNNSLREQLIAVVTAEVHSTDGPFGVIPRTVDAVMTALEARLDIGEEQAWCKTCRRIWEGRGHRCETDAEQALAAVREALASFNDRGVLRVGHTNLDIPTAGEVIDAVRAALDQPQEQP